MFGEMTENNRVKVRSLRSLAKLGHVVYVLKGADGFYIGKSNNLWQRFKAWGRKGSPSWFNGIDRHVWVCCCISELECGIAELILINKLNPSLNVRMSDGLWREEYNSLLGYLKWEWIDLCDVKNWRSGPDCLSFASRRHGNVS